MRRRTQEQTGSGRRDPTGCAPQRLQLGTRIGRNAAVQFEEAGLEYQNGGARALASYLDWQRSFYPTLEFYFVRNGRDLVTGTSFGSISQSLNLRPQHTANVDASSFYKSSWGGNRWH